VVELGNHPISQLSVHLHFQDTTAFYGCPNLKTATGTYPGWVNFAHSSIEKIEELNVTRLDRCRETASFKGCSNLKVATGTYTGFVDFSNSGIKKIEDLKITQPNHNGDAATFYSCPNLKTFRGTYNGKVHLEDTPIQKGPKWLLNPTKANIDPQTRKILTKLFQKPLDLEL